MRVRKGAHPPAADRVLSPSATEPQASPPSVTPALREACEDCGAPLAETGAPIWESYCPNLACDREKRAMARGVQDHIIGQLHKQAREWGADDRIFAEKVAARFNWTLDVAYERTAKWRAGGDHR